MVLVTFIMSQQQLLSKWAAADMSPTLQIGWRSLFAVLLIGGWVLLRGLHKSFVAGAFWPGLVAGVLFALEYLGLGEGLKYTTASHAVVFLYTAPIFAALGLHFTVTHERLSPLQWAGILLAFGGIAMAFLGTGSESRDGSQSASSWFGDLLCMLGGLAWGATTVLIRNSVLSHAPVMQTLVYQLAGACVILLSYGLFGAPLVVLSDAVLISLTIQTLVVSVAALLTWFWLLRNYQASRLGVLSFMTPLWGVALGVLLLDEPLEPGFAAGALLVLGGILLVSGSDWLKQRHQFKSQPPIPEKAV
nr:DMT family transporter [Oceanobacter mangrovi]